MVSLLHASVRENVKDLHREFLTNQPFRHVVIEQFLDPAFCRELMTEFPRFDAAHAYNEHGETGRKAVFPNLGSLSPAYARFDHLMQDRDFLSLVGRITDVPGLVYDPEYVGGGTHENLGGQELDAHVDFNYHPTRRLHRRLNLIVFMNPKWDESWGGCLELLRDPWATGGGERKLMLPLANRGVIFETTEWSWHGFRRIQLPPNSEISRRSIAVYFYTKERPVLQTAPSHGTIYYQRPLPEHIQTGYTLSDQDLAEIQVLLERRDKQIQFLYDREKEFSKVIEVIEGIAASPSFRLGRALTWPARVLRGLFRKPPGG